MPIDLKQTLQGIQLGNFSALPCGRSESEHITHLSKSRKANEEESHIASILNYNYPAFVGSYYLDMEFWGTYKTK